MYIAGSNIGDFAYIESGRRISATEIGRFCSIGPYSFIVLPEHPTRRFVSTHPILFRNRSELGYDLVEDGVHEYCPRRTSGTTCGAAPGPVSRVA